MALSKIQGIGLGVVLLVALAAGVFWGPKILNLTKDTNTYLVVYLQSGEIYVGKLSRFPRMKITDTYLLKNTADPKTEGKTNLQLLPLSETVWAPTELYLDLSNILFYGPLSESSAAAQALAKAGKK